MMLRVQFTIPLFTFTEGTLLVLLLWHASQDERCLYHEYMLSALPPNPALHHVS